MSWGSDAIQAAGQNSGGASGAGAGAAGAGAAQSGSSWAPNMAAASNSGSSFRDFYDAVKKDIAHNNENRVDVPQSNLQAQMPSIQQFARQPMMGQPSQFQQPPTITGYNL